MMMKQACLQREQQGQRQRSSLIELFESTGLFGCCELNELNGMIELIGCLFGLFGY